MLRRRSQHPAILVIILAVAAFLLLRYFHKPPPPYGCYLSATQCLSSISMRSVDIVLDPVLSYDTLF
jgi:hypothetical protein